MELFPGLTMPTSTTVIHRVLSFGAKHARPSGSGIRAIKTSPSNTSLQRSCSNLFSLTKRFDLSRNIPSPMSASCSRRMLPAGSWSLVSTQSPSEKSPSKPIRSSSIAFAQPTGIPLTPQSPQSALASPCLAPMLQRGSKFRRPGVAPWLGPPERPRRHFHAERGSEQCKRSPIRGRAALDLMQHLPDVAMENAPSRRGSRSHDPPARRSWLHLLDLFP